MKLPFQKNSSLLSASERYLESVGFKIMIVLLFVSVAVLSMVFDVSLGPGDYPLKDVVATLFDRSSISIQMEVVVWDLRFPIAVMAILIGVMLSLAGAQMQTILNNPLADPFTLGISAAASFGAALGIVIGRGVPYVGYYLVTANAFFFAFAASLVLYFLAKLRGVTIETMILVGIALLFAFNAMLAMLQYSADETQLQQLIFWMMGSLGRSSWTKIAICSGILALSIPFFVFQTWSMTALRLGEDKAKSLGISVERLRLQTLMIVSLLSAVAVAFIGVIGFVGLVAPHIARMLVGEDQRFFLPTAMAAGAVIMSLTSIASKMLVPGVIFPIGIITSLIGIPFFISIIMSVRRNNWT